MSPNRNGVAWFDRVRVCCGIFCGEVMPSSRSDFSNVMIEESFEYVMMFVGAKYYHWLRAILELLLRFPFSNIISIYSINFSPFYT
jgi:hypothetical protein